MSALGTGAWPAAPPARAPETRSIEPCTPTVYVVERDDAVRDALAVSLEDAGYSVVPLASPTAFLAACRSGRPGCVLLDLDLPGIDDPALLDALHGRRVTLPMVMTTPALRRHRRRAQAFPGYVTLLEKPFGTPELLGRVEDAMRRGPPPSERTAGPYGTSLR